MKLPIQHKKIQMDIEFQTDVTDNNDVTAKHRFGRARRYYHRRRDKKPEKIYPRSIATYKDMCRDVVYEDSYCTTYIHTTKVTTAN